MKITILFLRKVKLNYEVTYYTIVNLCNFD